MKNQVLLFVVAILWGVSILSLIFVFIHGTKQPRFTHEELEKISLKEMFSAHWRGGLKWALLLFPLSLLSAYEAWMLIKYDID